MKISGPRLLLQFEGLVALVAASSLYHAEGFAPWKFAALFLAPDLAMVGYAFGPKAGAACYNLAHTYLVISVLWLTGHFLGLPSTQPLCLIWVAHIGFDRLLGYGFKYPTAFKDTHFDRV